jgi:hypothetical protein
MRGKGEDFPDDFSLEEHTDKVSALCSGIKVLECLRPCMSYLSPLTLVALFLGLLLLPTPLSLAHGGGTPQLTNEPVGPYLLSAWTNPDPAVVGEMHITVALALAETGDAVTDPTVRVMASPQDSQGDAISVVASHEGALTPIFYEADLDFSHAGPWRIQIKVAGNEGSGGAGFQLEVREKGLNWLLVGIIGSVAVVVVWMGWMIFRPKTR